MRHTSLARFIIAAAFAFSTSIASAANVKIIFPYAAGGGGDTLARVLAERLQAETGDNVVVENRTGSAGLIGVNAVRNATPDGTTILLSPIAPVAIFPHTYAELGYDPFTDFAPVSQAVNFDYGLAINPAIPAKTTSELVAWLKANPDRATYGSPGTGALPQFTGILFGRQSGISLTHVPYKGSAPAISDLMGGHISLVFLPVSDLIELNKSKNIRLIATTGEKRSAFTPDLPTLKESGLDIVANGWYGFYVPARTPKATVEKLEKFFVSASRSPDIHARVLGFGLEPTVTTALELAAIQKSDSDKWGPVIKASGFTAD